VADPARLPDRHAAGAVLTWVATIFVDA
jgi:hypothetical protein